MPMPLLFVLHRYLTPQHDLGYCHSIGCSLTRRPDQLVCFFVRHAGGISSCILTVSNTGNATLLSVTVMGQTTACAAKMVKGAAVNCTVTRHLDQQAFDTWDATSQPVQLEATVVANTGPYSDVPSINGSVSAALELTSRQSVTTSASVAPSAVVAAGEQHRALQKGCSMVLLEPSYDTCM